MIRADARLRGQVDGWSSLHRPVTFKGFGQAYTPARGYFVAGLVEKAVRLALLMWAARFADLDGMARWNLMSLALVFIGIPQLAAINGLRRELPLLADEDERASVLGSSLVLALVLPALGIVATLLWSNALAVGVAAAVAGQTAMQWSNAALVGALDYRRALAQQLWSIGSLIALGCTIIPFADVAGYAVVLGLSGAIAGVAVRPRVRFGELSERWRCATQMSFAGFWPMLVGIVFWFPTSLDRPIVGASLGMRELGIYTLATQVASALLWIRAGIAEQGYAGVATGVRSGASEVETLAKCRWLMALMAGATIAAVVLLVLAGGPLVAAYLPAFRPGLVAAGVAGLAAIGGIPLQVAGIVFHALRKSRRYFWWHVLTSAVALGVMWAAALLTGSLWSVPAASGLAMAAIGAMAWRDATRLLTRGAREP